MQDTANTEKRYYDFAEVETETGITRSMIWHWVKRMKLPTHKFVSSGKTFLAKEEVDQLKEMRARLAGTKEEEEKTHYTLEEVRALTGIGRAQLFVKIDKWKLTAYHFPGTRKTYLEKKDVVFLQQLQQDPSLAGPKE